MAESAPRAVSLLRRAVMQRLMGAGIETPDIDSRKLIELATGLSAEDLARDPHRELPVNAISRLDALVERRLGGEPVSRIAGWREFYGRKFLLGPETLDPRPETEVIIDTVLDLMGKLNITPHARILDIGTGTGCILLTLLAELEHAEGVGTDISVAALDVARHNAANLALAQRASFLERRTLENVAGPFDIVVSNPPYIATGAMAGLAPEVRLYDPVAALDGGTDGLAIYREIAERIPAVLPHGLLVLEVGYDQAAAVVDLFRGKLRQRIATQHFARDLGGHIRCVALEIQS